MLLRIDNTGGKRAVRKPPFCRMRRFFVSDVFLIARALTIIISIGSLPSKSSIFGYSSTQVCFLRTGHRNVSFYNVFSTLPHAIDKLSVTLFDVITSRFVAHFSYALQNGQKRFQSTTHLCSIPRRTLNLSTNAPIFIPWNVYIVSLFGKNVCSQSQLSVLLRS